MPTNTSRILELKSARSLAIKRASALLDEAERASRDLSRREKAEYETINRDIDRLGAELRSLGGEFDPRFTQGTPLAGADDGSLDLLTREERVSDWLRERGNYQLPAGLDGLGDPSRFSLGKLVRGACTGNWQGSELEQRALSEGTLAQGGYLIPSPLAASMIDRVRAQSRVFQAGAMTVPMEANELNLARLTGGASVAWKTENAAIAQSSMTFDRLTLKAQTLPILVTLSAELFEDLSPQATDLIEHEMAMALSLELDRVCLRGSGSAPEPRGIRNQSGVTIQSLGANGAPLLPDNLIDGVSNVRNLNIEPNALIMASRTQSALGKQKDSTGNYLPTPPSIASVQQLISNVVPINLTQGSSNVASEVYIGHWPDLLVGIRTDLRFQVRLLDQRYIDNLQYGLLAYLRADCVLQHPEGFNVITGVL